MLLPSLFLRQSTKLTHNAFQQVYGFFQICNRFLTAFNGIWEIIVIHDGVITNQAEIKTIVRVLGDFLTGKFAPTLTVALAQVFIPRRKLIKVANAIVKPEG